jgi:alpha-beta hydrolase superfamily lysophospholipase
MVQHKVFGVERDIDIAREVFPSAEELEQLEAPLGEHVHGWFDSCMENAKLHYRCFLPKAGNKAIVIFLNGITTHSGEGLQLADGRKTNVALLREVFGASNIALYSYDQYGHGYSEGTRFFIPSWEGNLKDYLSFIKLVDEKHKGSLPVFIMGHSYGGALTIHASRSIQNDPSIGPKNFGGAIFTAPAVLVDLPPAPVYYSLRYVLAPLFPRWIPSFMPNPISSDRIWSDPEVLQRHREPRIVEMKVSGAGDPYRLGTALNLVLCFDKVVKAIPGYNVPFFLAHGTEDYGVKLEGSEYMWATVDTPEEDREFHKIDGGYHDLYSFKESTAIVKMMTSWIEKRISK